MLLFRIIMISCMLIMFIVMFASLSSANKPKKNMFMAVTLPYDVLESDFIKEIQKEYKSLCNKVYIIMSSLVPIQRLSDEGSSTIQLTVLSPSELRVGSWRSTPKRRASGW